MADLERELAKYRELLPTLATSEGKFALIYKGELKGVYDSYPDALSAGYELAGLDTFLVKQIAATEYVSYFTRDIVAACHT
jgi:hypothetical protein